MNNFLTKTLAVLLFVSVAFLPEPRAASAPGASASQRNEATPLSLRSFHRKPKLVLVLVVDQFRSDYLTRFHKRFLPARAKDGRVGGYSYLMSEGAYYPFAQYDILQCMTAPGHSIILSGSYPYQTGIPLNYWYDSRLNQPVYCVQDLAEPLVGGTGKGMSPRNFLGNTVGDELKNAGYPSRVVGIALKDRASILMGGHRADLALWFDPGNFRWVSSKYYLPDSRLPGWVENLNQEIGKTRGKPYVFEASKKLTGLASQNPNFRYETTVGTKVSLSYPLGLELTASAAEKALESYKLGQGKAADILAVSFSTHDYLAHHYGPNAAELEELTVAEDRVISSLLNAVKRKVPGGLKDVLVILTADHGGPPQAELLKEARMDSGKLDGIEISKILNAQLDSKFGKPKEGNWVSFVSDLNFFFSPGALAEKGLSREALEEEAKATIRRIKGVAYVFSKTDYEMRRLPPGMFGRQVIKTYIPGKSGDLVILPKPFFMDSDHPVSHMTGYSYDRSVPLVLAGARIQKGVYSTPADVVDLAPTLSFLLGVIAPSTSEGRILSEILKDEPSK